MEDFVNFELAVKLKEKGFREDCIAYYHTDGELLYNRDEYRGGDYKSLLNSYNSLPKNPIGCEQIDAPTISQVLKWLREEKNFYVAIDFFRFNGNTELWWTYTVRYIEDDSTENIFESCKRESWELAALAGIEYVLDNLI